MRTLVLLFAFVSTACGQCACNQNTNPVYVVNVPAPFIPVVQQSPCCNSRVQTQQTNWVQQPKAGFQTVLTPIPNNNTVNYLNANGNSAPIATPQPVAPSTQAGGTQQWTQPPATQQPTFVFGQSTPLPTPGPEISGSSPGYVPPSTPIQSSQGNTNSYNNANVNYVPGAPNTGVANGQGNAPNLGYNTANGAEVNQNPGSGGYNGANLGFNNVNGNGNGNGNGAAAGMAGVGVAGAAANAGLANGQANPTGYNNANLGYNTANGQAGQANPGYNGANLGYNPNNGVAPGNNQGASNAANLNYNQGLPAGGASNQGANAYNDGNLGYQNGQPAGQNQGGNVLTYNPGMGTQLNEGATGQNSATPAAGGYNSANLGYQPGQQFISPNFDQTPAGAGQTGQGSSGANGAAIAAGVAAGAAGLAGTAGTAGTTGQGGQSGQQYNTATVTGSGQGNQPVGQGNPGQYQNGQPAQAGQSAQGQPGQVTNSGFIVPGGASSSTMMPTTVSQNGMLVNGDRGFMMNDGQQQPQEGASNGQFIYSTTPFSTPPVYSTTAGQETTAMPTQSGTTTGFSPIYNENDAGRGFSVDDSQQMQSSTPPGYVNIPYNNQEDVNAAGVFGAGDMGASTVAPQTTGFPNQYQSTGYPNEQTTVAPVFGMNDQYGQYGQNGQNGQQGSSGANGAAIAAGVAAGAAGVAGAVGAAGQGVQSGFQSTAAPNQMQNQNQQYQSTMSPGGETGAPTREYELSTEPGEVVQNGQVGRIVNGAFVPNNMNFQYTRVEDGNGGAGGANGNPSSGGNNNEASTMASSGAGGDGRGFNVPQYDNSAYNMNTVYGNYDSTTPSAASIQRDEQVTASSAAASLLAALLAAALMI